LTLKKISPRVEVNAEIWPGLKERGFGWNLGFLRESLIG
jgi:hypothetical protein